MLPVRDNGRCPHGDDLERDHCSLRPTSFSQTGGILTASAVASHSAPPKLLSPTRQRRKPTTQNPRRGDSRGHPPRHRCQIGPIPDRRRQHPPRKPVHHCRRRLALPAPTPPRPRLRHRRRHLPKWLRSLHPQEHSGSGNSPPCMALKTLRGAGVGPADLQTPRAPPA